MTKPVRIVGLGGSLRAESTSRAALEFIVRSLRGWSVPLVMPVPQSWRTFDPEGRLVDQAIADQLKALGAEVVRAARQFQDQGTCDYAEHQPYAADRP